MKVGNLIVVLTSNFRIVMVTSLRLVFHVLLFFAQCVCSMAAVDDHLKPSLQRLVVFFVADLVFWAIHLFSSINNVNIMLHML